MKRIMILLLECIFVLGLFSCNVSTEDDDSPDEDNEPNVSFVNRSAYRVSVCRDGLTNEIAVVGAYGTESVYVSPGHGEITFHFRYSYCVIDDAYSGTVWMAAEDSDEYTYPIDSADIEHSVVQVQIPAPKNPTFRDSYLVVENKSEQPVSLYKKSTQYKLHGQEKCYIQPHHSGAYCIQQPDAPFEGFSLKSSSAESAVFPFYAESGVVYKCEFDGSGAAAVATEYVRQRELYTVTFEANGGTEISPVETSLLNEPSMPAPEKQGYQFAGWYVDGECRQPVEYPYAVNADTSLYAKWIESGDTAYTVKHYQQNTDFESYTLTKTEPRTGTTGAPTAAKAEVYEGFTARPFEQKPIAADGKTVINIYYARNKYTVTFDSNNGTGDTAKQIFYYGVPQNLNENVFLYPCYTFTGWGLSETSDVVYANQAEFCGEYTAGITLYAKWVSGITVTGDTVGDVDLSDITGEYTIKVVGAISQSTLTTLADKMKNKKDILVNLDLSEAVLTVIASASNNNSIFADCPLNSIVLPKTLVTIEGYAFYNCSIKSVTIPANVQTVGRHAFDYCQNLESVEIDETETVGDYAFYYCKKLKTVVLKNITTIGNSAFNYCQNLESVEIDGTETVGDSAFYNCETLKTVVLKNITTIGNYAFGNCTSIVSITIDSQTIGSYAFNSCTSLTSVIIGKNVKSISSYCFKNCSALTSVRFENTENWYYRLSSTYEREYDVTNAANNATGLQYSSNTYYKK